LPIIYQILVNLSYLSLFPLTIFLFINSYDILPDLLIAFLIYQLIMGVLIFLFEISDIVKMQTRSQFLFDIQTENEIYEVDDNEISKWKTEFREARLNFRGHQET